MRVAGNIVVHSYVHEDDGIWFHDSYKPANKSSAPRTLKTLLVDIAESCHLIRASVVPKTLEGSACFRCHKAVQNASDEFCKYCCTRVHSPPGHHAIYDVQSREIELAAEELAAETLSVTAGGQ